MRRRRVAPAARRVLRRRGHRLRLPLERLAAQYLGRDGNHVPPGTASGAESRRERGEARLGRRYRRLG
eukprot:1163235-Prorocentrum_minimum.AAC.8